MTVDLTNMTPEMTRELNQIASGYRKPYTEFVDRLSETYGGEEFWWDTPLVSRNIYNCDCFRDACTLRLALNLIERERPDSIVVANRAMKAAILQNTAFGADKIEVKQPKGLKAKLKESDAVMSRYVLRRVEKQIRSLQEHCSPKSLEYLYGKELVLVETYRIPSEIRDGELHDRYFPGLSENSDENIVFLSLLSFSKPEDGCRLLDALAEREDTICTQLYVEPRDFAAVRRYIRWCLHLKIQACSFDGMQVQALVQSAIRKGSLDNTAMIGILLGQAIPRLIDRYGLKARRLIDWYEGQPSSNAIIRRFREKFPDVPTVGYVLSPCGENNLGLYPSKLQKKTCSVPEYYAIPGKCWKESVLQFERSAKCVPAPSFRRANVFELNLECAQEKVFGTILLQLPGMIGLARQMLSVAAFALKDSRFDKIYIRNHPINEKKKISDYSISEKAFGGREVIYEAGGLADALRGKETAVFCATTSALEAMLSGVFSIIFTPSGELNNTCLPSTASQGFHIVYSAQDLKECLREGFSQLELLDARALREDAFIRVSRKTVKDFTELSAL